VFYPRFKLAVMVSVTTDPNRERFALKGSAYRGYALVLRRDQRMEAVCARLPPATAALLRDPPPSTAWIDYVHLRDLSQLVAEMYGIEYWAQVAYESTRDSMMPLLRTVVEGVLRLFGATPHTLFSRMHDSSSLTTRGFRATYTRLGDNSGEVTIAYPGHDDVPHAMSFASGRSMLQITCELCGRTGSWDPPEKLPVSAGCAYRFRVRWT
jgi:hypothetical protein